MKRYIAMLRGINVAGQKKVPMADLRRCLTGQGFEHVATYIQSGNVVFEAGGFTTVQAGLALSKAIREEFGFEVKALVMEPQTLQKALQSSPYLRDPGRDPKCIYFVFLFEQPNREAIEKLSGVHYPSEEFVYEPGCIHFYAGRGMGKAKMNNNFFEQKLKVNATTRNLNTVVKLLEIVGLKK